MGKWTSQKPRLLLGATLCWSFCAPRGRWNASIYRAAWRRDRWGGFLLWPGSGGFLLRMSPRKSSRAFPASPPTRGWPPSLRRRIMPPWRIFTAGRGRPPFLWCWPTGWRIPTTWGPLSAQRRPPEPMALLSPSGTAPALPRPQPKPPPGPRPICRWCGCPTSAL